MQYIVYIYFIQIYAQQKLYSKFVNVPMFTDFYIFFMQKFNSIQTNYQFYQWSIKIPHSNKNVIVTTIAIGYQSIDFIASYYFLILKSFFTYKQLNLVFSYFQNVNVSINFEVV